MSPLTARDVQAAWPRPPVAIRDEVELYARETGRTATVHCVPGAGWFARFELRCNDPAMRMYQEGRAEKPPTEDVFFHVARRDYDKNVHPVMRGHEPGKHKHWSDFLPLDIEQMGAAGVRSFLEAGNTWSGRGLHRSQVDAFQKAEEANSLLAAKQAREAEDRAGQRVKDRRRQVLGVPYLRVGKDLTSGD